VSKVRKVAYIKPQTENRRAATITNSNNYRRADTLSAVTWWYTDILLMDKKDQTALRKLKKMKRVVNNE
jgi:hypothetical protein